MDAPACALCILHRMMQVLSGLVSLVYELWGGGPQVVLVTVIQVNLYSNWITDICEPGITQEEMLSSGCRLFHLRCTFGQMWDCQLRLVLCLMIVISCLNLLLATDVKHNLLQLTLLPLSLIPLMLAN